MGDQDFNIKVVTTADTSGIKQTAREFEQLKNQQATFAETARREAAAATAGGTGQLTDQMKAAQQSAFQLGQALRVIGLGAVVTGGYKLVSTLRNAATEIEKLSQSLSKQGEQIVANAQKYAELSKFARDNADIIKIGEGALKEVESAQRRLTEEAGKELTIWQKIADVWAAGFKDKGPIAQAQELTKAQAAQNYEMARTSAIQAISSAKMIEARRAAQTYEETIAELTKRMQEQEDLAAVHWLQKDIESYLVAAGAAEKYKNQIESLKKAHDAENAAAEKRIAILRATADAAKKTADELNKAKTPGQQAGERREERGRQAEEKQLKERLSHADPREAADIRDRLTEIQQERVDKAQQEQDRQQAAEKAAQEAARAEAERQRAEAEQQEKKRAEGEKIQDTKEVQKYGRILSPDERNSERIKKEEADRQKKFQDDEAARQQQFKDQDEAQRRGITPEQLRNEREAKGQRQPDQAKQDQKGGDNQVVTAIGRLEDKFDRYWA